MVLVNKANTFKIFGLFVLIFLLLIQPASAQVPGFDCNSQTDIEVDECLALLAFHSSTGGDTWDDDFGWLGSATICDDWIGIICSGTNVTSLVLGNNNLTGTLPPEIDDLSALTTLNVQTNSLTNLNPTDPIPAELANLTTLTTLNLSGNLFTGTFPTEILSLGNLIDLNIGFNEFSGNLPSEISNLSWLERFNIENNKFDGEIPISFSALPLDYFDTTNNDDLCLPDELTVWYIGIADPKGSLELCFIPDTETPTPVPDTLTPTPIPLPTLTPTITNTPTITLTPTMLGQYQTLTAFAYEDTLTATANWFRTPTAEVTATKYYILVSQTLIPGDEVPDNGDQDNEIPIPEDDDGGGISGLWWLLLIIPLGMIGAGIFLELRGRQSGSRTSSSESSSESSSNDDNDDDLFQTFVE
jgi:hypothetical protein